MSDQARQAAPDELITAQVAAHPAAAALVRADSRWVLTMTRELRDRYQAGLADR